MCETSNRSLQTFETPNVNQVIVNVELSLHKLTNWNKLKPLQISVQTALK